MKLGTLRQILNPMTVTWSKIEVFKTQDGGGRHLENCFFGHNSSTDCPISAKFCMRNQNSMSTRVTWQKLQIFLNPRCRTAAILKIVKLPSQWKIVRFWWNLVHYIRYWTRWQSHDAKLKFLTFKMAAAAILKIAFLAITHQPIVRFQRNFVQGSRTVCWQGLRVKKCKFLKFNMADGRHFENR